VSKKLKPKIKNVAAIFVLIKFKILGQFIILLFCRTATTLHFMRLLAVETKVTCNGSGLYAVVEFCVPSAETNALLCSVVQNIIV
jgi:hypothetical protein